VVNRVILAAKDSQHLSGYDVILHTHNRQECTLWEQTPPAGLTADEAAQLWKNSDDWHQLALMTPTVTPIGERF
jgi:hypothetical protein